MSRFTYTAAAVLAIWLMLAGPTAFAGDRFTDNGDGTVTDHERNLMWAQSDNQGDMSWNEAAQWIEYTFSIGTPYTDWRLPTLDELKSLYVEDKSYKGYESDCGQRVKIVKEITLSCGWVWTSEKHSITARVFNFNRGYHYTDRRVHKRAYRVLPVRSIKKTDKEENGKPEGKTDG